MSVQQEKFKAIADRIRAHTETTDLIKPSEFADKIDYIAEDKYTLGKTDGYTEGETAGIEKGRQAQYDEFWDIYQNYGNRTSYVYGFGAENVNVSTWNETTFKPKYDIKPVRFFSGFRGIRITDLAAHLESLGVCLDTSNCTDMQLAFQNSFILTHVPVLDIRKSTNNGAMFGYCGNLQTIDKLIVSETSVFAQTFYDCKSLANIVVEGVIGNNIDFQHSPLTKESIMGKLITSEEYDALSDEIKANNVLAVNGEYYYGGIITALKSDATGKTLTLNKEAKEAVFTDEEWSTLTATKTNWTISLV